MVVLVFLCCSARFVYFVVCVDGFSLRCLFFDCDYVNSVDYIGSLDLWCGGC